jgi:hypothetical protein
MNLYIIVIYVIGFKAEIEDSVYSELNKYEEKNLEELQGVLQDVLAYFWLLWVSLWTRWFTRRSLPWLMDLERLVFILAQTLI